MKNSRSQSKAARRKLEDPMPAAMPCKIPIKSSGETHRNIGKRRTKYACVVDADERTRPRVQGAVNKPHQDHIAAKGMNSLTHYSLVHKFIPMPQEKSECKSSSGKRMGKLHKKSGMSADESQKQERFDRRSKEQGRKNSFRVVDGYFLTQEFGVGTSKSKSTKAGSYSEVILKKMILVRTQYSLNRARQRPKWQPHKSSTLYPDFQDVQVKAADAVSAYTQVKMENAPTLFKIPMSAKDRYVWIQSTTMQTWIISRVWFCRRRRRLNVNIRRSSVHFSGVTRLCQ